MHGCVGSGLSLHHHVNMGFMFDTRPIKVGFHRHTVFLLFFFLIYLQKSISTNKKLPSFFFNVKKKNNKEAFIYVFFIFIIWILFYTWGLGGSLSLSHGCCFHLHLSPSALSPFRDESRSILLTLSSPSLRRVAGIRRIENPSFSVAVLVDLDST